MKRINKGSEKYIFIDLWGTIFFETGKSSDINYDRGKIIYNIIKTNNEEFWKKRIEENITEFKIEENLGYTIKPIQRIKKIIDKEDTKDEICLKILEEFDNLIINKYTPIVNTYIINMIKTKKNVILISNTGLTTKRCVIQLLEKYKIKNIFKDLIFSEDYKYCKPNINFFKIPIEKYMINPENIIMIGDSTQKDFIPCTKLGIECIVKDWENIEIQQKLEKILHEKIESMEICSRLEWKNIVYHCKTSKNEYAIKIFKKINNDNIRFNIELEMYKILKKLKISTPKLIYSGNIKQQNIIITEWINGKSIKSVVNELGIESAKIDIQNILNQYDKIWNYSNKNIYSKLLKNRLESNQENYSMILTRLNENIDIFMIDDIDSCYLYKLNEIKKYYYYVKYNIKNEYKYTINSDISMHEIIIKDNNYYWIDLETFTIGDINNDLAGIFYSISNSIYYKDNEVDKLEKIIKENKYYNEKIFIFYLIERVFCAYNLDKGVSKDEIYYFIDYINKHIKK